jgi:hypothetical protein
MHNAAEKPVMQLASQHNGAGRQQRQGTKAGQQAEVPAQLC